MTESEFKLFSLCLFYLIKYYQSNPDVGIGPSVWDLIDRISIQTGVSPTCEQRELLFYKYNNGV